MGSCSTCGSRLCGVQDSGSRRGLREAAAAVVAACACSYSGKNSAQSILVQHHRKTARQQADSGSGPAGCLQWPTRAAAADLPAGTAAAAAAAVAVNAFLCLIPASVTLPTTLV